MTKINPEKNTLVVTQTSHHFDFEPEGHSVTLRIIEPSAPYGGWPGNAEQIREWKICEKDGNAVYRACTQDEVRAFEKLIGTENDLEFIMHRTLGEVCVLI